MTPEARELCLQERFAPDSICFGCGPANTEGLHVRSFAAAEDSDEVVARWQAAPRHQAFEGVLNGGIIGTLLDCHSNWAAAWHLKRRRGASRPPVTVTGRFHVRLRKPTPIDLPVELRARAVESEDAKVRVEAELSSDGEVTATCEGLFVAVEPDHPAYHGWPSDRNS